MSEQCQHLSTFPRLLLVFLSILFIIFIISAAMMVIFFYNFSQRLLLRDSYVDEIQIDALLYNDF